MLGFAARKLVQRGGLRLCRANSATDVGEGDYAVLARLLGEESRRLPDSDH